MASTPSCSPCRRAATDNRDIPHFVVTNGVGVGGPAAATCTWVELAFRRALRWVGCETLRAAARGADVLQRELKAETEWVWGQRWRGFVPNEVTYPARSLNPCTYIRRWSTRTARPCALTHEARRPRLGSEKEPQARCPASGGAGAPSTLATTPRLPGEWARACRLARERTAYAHGCAQRAGVTTQRRHQAAPALSQTHANSALSSLLPKKRSVRGGPESPHHNQ